MGNHFRNSFPDGNHRDHRMDRRGDDAVGVSAADERAVALALPNLPMAQCSLGCRLHREQRVERCIAVRHAESHLDGDRALRSLPRRARAAWSGGLTSTQLWSCRDSRL